MSSSSGRLLGLLLLNLCLQVFDGVATYFGVTSGFGEGNPLIAAAFEHVGVGPALCMAKGYASGCLLLIWHLRGRSMLAVPALVGTALTYVMGSVAPWGVAFSMLE
jgi:hypothetical protein